MVPILSFRFALKGRQEISNTYINAVSDTSYVITVYMSCVHCSVYPIFVWGVCNIWQSVYHSAVSSGAVTTYTDPSFIAFVGSSRNRAGTVQPVLYAEMDLKRSPADIVASDHEYHNIRSLLIS